MQEDFLTTQLGIQGFRVTAVEQRTTIVARSASVFHLQRTKVGHICGGCEQLAPGYDHEWQEVQHLTFWQHLSFLRFEHYRVDCPKCGVRTEALDFVYVFSDFGNIIGLN